MRCAMPSMPIVTTGRDAREVRTLSPGPAGAAARAESLRAADAAATAASSSLSGSSGLGSPFFSTARYSADVAGRSYDVMSSQPEFRPKLVLPRNHRYLPEASHAGEVASARPSVSCAFRPVSTSYAKIARNIDGSRREYAIHRPSGLKRGFSDRSGIMDGSVSTNVDLPDATSTTQSRRWVSWKAMRFASGLHSGV